MSDHRERTCTQCGSLLHHGDECRRDGSLKSKAEALYVAMEIDSDGVNRAFFVGTILAALEDVRREALEEAAKECDAHDSSYGKRLLATQGEIARYLAMQIRALKGAPR